MNDASSGAPIYCPHGPFGVPVDLRDGSDCKWSYDRNDKRGRGFLDVHLRVVHKNIDPRPAPAEAPKKVPSAAPRIVDTREGHQESRYPATELVEPGTEAPKVDTETVRKCRRCGQHPANTRYDRGPLSGLCEETCIDLERGEMSERMKSARAGRPRPEQPGPVEAALPAIVERAEALEDIDVAKIILSGDHTDAADRLRGVAEVLRRKAGALDVIAGGLDALSETEDG